jgi:hypothetical protein
VVLLQEVKRTWRCLPNPPTLYTLSLAPVSCARTGWMSR